MEKLTSYQAERDDSDLHQLSKKIETGFPSPAGDHLEKALNLEDLIVRRPTSTFYVRVEGDAMQAAGIHDGDILVVDRSLTPSSGSILIFTMDEEVMIRRYIKQGQRRFLVTDNPSSLPIPIDPHTQWMIWGVATHLIHRFRKVEEGVKGLRD